MESAKNYLQRSDPRYSKRVSEEVGVVGVGRIGRAFYTTSSRGWPFASGGGMLDID